MQKIRKGDKVKVMRGKDAGKEGIIDRVINKTDYKGRVIQVVIPGVNIVKKHQKPNTALNLPGGIIEIEKPIDVSNVMLLDAKSGKPTRVRVKADAKGIKTREAVKSGQKI